MAGSFNRITLVGNLTRDPEIRYVGSGAAVTKFTLAVNRRSKQQEETTTSTASLGTSSPNLQHYLKKGMSCLVDGRLSIRSYDDKTAISQATEVVVNTMQMLDRANPRRRTAARTSARPRPNDNGGATTSDVRRQCSAGRGRDPVLAFSVADAS